MEKKYTPHEVGHMLLKSLYKMVKKALDSKVKEESQKIVQDIVDPNYVAEINPTEVPEAKQKVLWKKKDKGIEKLKKFKQGKYKESLKNKK